MKRLIALLMALVLVLSLAGCSGSPSDDKTTGETPDVGGETTTEDGGDVVDREPVTITFGGWGDYFLLREQCDKFEEKYPWITVEVVKPVGIDWYAEDLMQLAAIGEMPDVFNIENLSVAMQNEWCLDITEYFENDEDSKNYPEWLLEYCMANDRMYTLVSTLYVDFIQVNTTLLDEYNIPTPSYDWTIDEWTEVLRETSVLGSSIGTGNIIPYLQWLPAQFGNEDIGYYSYNTATKQFEFGTEFIETVNLLKEMFDDSVSLYDTMDIEIGINGDSTDAAVNQQVATDRFNYMMDNYGATTNFWYKGLFGIQSNSSWALNWTTYFADIYTGFDWDIYPMPVKNEGDQSRTCILNEFLAVSAATEHPYESYLLMKYMSYDLDGFEAKVDFMANYDKQTYIDKYDGMYDPTSFATTLYIYQMPPSTEDRALELYERINPDFDKEGLGQVFSMMNEGGFLNGIRIIPGFDEIGEIITEAVLTEVFTGNKTAADLAEELEGICNDILNEKREEFGLN